MTTLRTSAALLAALLLAACQAGADTVSPQPTDTPEPTEEATASPETTASESESMEPDDATLVEVASSATLGEYLTDADGMTLYVFLNDSPGESSCTGGCLANWPPLSVDASEEPTAADGVTAELGTLERDDGSTQVTLDGWPLYYFAGDAAAGDTNGEGVGDVWFVARPDGSVPGATASDPYNY